MNNHITKSVSENYHEIREHGNTAFPFASYLTTEASHDTPWHWHEEYELSIVTKGYVTCHIGSESFTLTEGDGLFINSGTLHAQSMAGSSPVLRKDELVFHGRLIYGSKYTVFWQKYIHPIASSTSLPYIHLHAAIDWQKEILNLIAEAVSFVRKQPFGYEFQIRHIVSQIFLLLCENQKKWDKDAPNEHFQEMLRTKRMLKFIQDHFSENIALKDIALHASICEREVQRTFQNVIHQSPIQYLIRYRIEKACQMLDSGEESIIEICNSCGFSSPSYFSKTFKKIVGCPPREYRRTR